MRHSWVLIASMSLSACGSADAGIVTSPSTVAASGGVVAAAADPMFNQGILHEVRIEMDPDHWAALRENFRTNQYYSANLSIDNEVILQVGVRSRGDGSRDPNKPGLKLDFNKYVKTQEFHGYKTLVLDNIVQDASMIRERLAYAVYEGMGIPAPQIAHARVTVNGEYWGVYAIVEPVSKPFLKSRLGEESGNLWDYEYSFSWDFTYRGDDPEEYFPAPLQPQTNEDKFDPAPFIEFVEKINELPDANFATEIGKYIDVDRFLTYIATENALAERDGFVGEQGMNNFYLYQYGNSTKFVLIPWDKDTAFTNASWPILFGVGSNVLTRRLLNDPAKLQVYKTALSRATSSFVNLTYLGPRLEQAYTQIREAALADTRKPYDNQTFENGVGGLRGLIGERANDVAAQMK